MKILFQVLVGTSLLFLAVALWRANYLKVPTVVCAVDVGSSFLLLFAGLLTSTRCWRAMLETSNCRASGASCIAGMGLSVFGKYLPGKVWTIAGRAAYSAQLYQESFTRLSLVSLRTQFVDLWTGLSLGVLGLSLVGGLHRWGWPAITLWLALTVLIFSQAVQTIVSAGVRFSLHRELRIPRVDLKSTLAVLPWFVLTWALWAIGFLLLVRGLVPGAIPWSVALGFPLAATLGILAVIAPGGLGVREGVLTGYLVLAGIPIADATTVAVTSRLWFLIGEIFIFTAGLVAHRLERRKEPRAAGSDEKHAPNSWPEKIPSTNENVCRP